MSMNVCSVCVAVSILFRQSPGKVCLSQMIYVGDICSLKGEPFSFTRTLLLKDGLRQREMHKLQNLLANKSDLSCSVESTLI